MRFFRHHRNKTATVSAHVPNSESTHTIHSFVGPQPLSPTFSDSSSRTNSTNITDSYDLKHDRENFGNAEVQYLVENGSDCSESPPMRQSCARPVIGCFRKHLLLHPRYQQIVCSTIRQDNNRNHVFAGSVLGNLRCYHERPLNYAEIRQARFRKVA